MMGYYTRYELTTISGDDHQTDHEQGVSAITDYTSLFDDSIKWYDHRKDMEKYSRMFPDTVFELYGEGEESGDMWKEYYKNGKSQLCKANITYDDYDESKLL